MTRKGETLIQSEVKSERVQQMSYNIVYMWNLENGTYELIYKAEVE